MSLNDNWSKLQSSMPSTCQGQKKKQGVLLSRLVTELAQSCGFHLAGIAPVVDSERPASMDQSEFPELVNFAQWVDEGRAGEMEYLKRRDAQGRLLRSSASIPFPWARSVIVCAVNYNNAHPYSIDTQSGDAAENSGWIARYAWSGRPPEPGSAEQEVQKLMPTDYHSVIRERLEKLRGMLQAELGEFESRCFVDTGPLIERVYAKYAGLGWQAKNTCLIHPRLGSWFFLGVIVTSLDLDREEWAQPLPDRCGSCTRCIDACPTDALEPYRMNAERCIAYLTIEKRGSIPAELAEKIGRNVFGCDICQEVCPWNRRSRALVTDWPELQPRPELVNPALDWLASLNNENFRKEFRKSPIERTKYAGWQRNVSIAQDNAAAHAGNPETISVGSSNDPL